MMLPAYVKPKKTKTEFYKDLLDGHTKHKQNLEEAKEKSIEGNEGLFVHKQLLLDRYVLGINKTFIK